MARGARGASVVAEGAPEEAALRAAAMVVMVVMAASMAV